MENIDSHEEVKADISEITLTICCRDEYCDGVKHVLNNEHIIEEDQLEDQDKIKDECPICFEDFNDNEVVLLYPCKHMFCLDCKKECSEYSCQLCRTKYTYIWEFNRLPKSLKRNYDLGDHSMCLYPNKHPCIREYVQSIPGEWKRFIQFMFKSQVDQDILLKGIDTLNLEKYKKNESLKYEQKFEEGCGCCAVIEIADNTFQLVLACLLPNLSVRLIISPIDDINFEVDNEYADEVVGYMNEQLAACWRSLSVLINKNIWTRVYVRKFEKLTLTLFLLGYNDVGIDDEHNIPMKEQLQNVKECNFDLCHKKTLQDKCPRLNLRNLKMPYFYESYGVCCKQKVEDEDNDDVENDNVIEEEVNSDKESSDDDDDSENDSSDSDSDESSKGDD